MKYLIVNGDDFGAGQGINRGILEAYRHGILTSTSLMVNMPASKEAAQLSSELLDLSFGLHVTFTDEEAKPLIDFSNARVCRTELQRQLDCFQRLIGRLPTHLDSHHNVHRDARLLPLFLDLARQYRLPLREHSPVSYFSRFYGQWDGVTHLEQISTESLVRMLETEIQEGCTELSCHPGYVAPGFESSYSVERETELQTLCDPFIRNVLVKRKIQLISFYDFANLLVN